MPFSTQLTYTDADTFEIIDFAELPYKTPSDDIWEAARTFAESLQSDLAQMEPNETYTHWTAHIRVPVQVRREQTPLPGDRVSFVENGKERTGIYQYCSYGEYTVKDEADDSLWTLNSMWKIKKL